MSGQDDSARLLKDAIRGGGGQRGVKEEVRTAALAEAKSIWVEEGSEESGEGEIKSLGWQAQSLRSQTHMARFSRGSV